MIDMSILKRVGNYILRGIPNYHINALIETTSPSNKLYQKKILISGGSRGLGYEMAKKFISEGAEVAITGRKLEVLKKVSCELNCEYILHDVSETHKSGDIIKEAETKLNGLDILINNAGISLHENSFLDVDEQQYDVQFNTNLKGPYFLSQAFIKHQLENKKEGNILFVSSERGETYEVLPYGLTKFAISSFVRGLAKRYINHGIRVNGIAPGVTASEMTGFSEDGNLYCAYNQTKRVYLPSEVAEVACFLISDISKTLNGQILVCNEGKTLNC